MKKLFILILLSQCFSTLIYSQSDCSNPLTIPICPSVQYSGQTNAGMGDDAPSGCNIAGEDVLYEILTPNGADKLYVSIRNASGPLQLSLEADTCGTGVCNALGLPAGNSDVSFNLSADSAYYLWVDASGTITYDISMGGDTGTIVVNIPNTQGNLQFETSSCALPSFQSSKPYYQVAYNSVYQTNPLTLAPLFIPGNMCITTYFRNTSGIEGVQQFKFLFDSAGYQNVSTPASVPGNYNAGNWIASNSGNLFVLTFVDSAGTGRGDFTGTPDTCLKYEFCFDMIPVSNDSLITNVGIEILSDGFGTGFTGPVTVGCCPVTLIHCLPSGGDGSIENNAHSFSFNFNDPAGAFPIELLEFTAKVISESIVINWTTASEINNDYFTIERSRDIKNWIEVDKVKGSGNSTSTRYYKITDASPFTGLSYYRLKQTDYDGTTSYSRIIIVNFKGSDEIKIYPNPTRNHFTLHINSAADIPYIFTLHDLAGREIESQNYISVNEDFDFGKELSPGFYFAEVIQAGVKKVFSLIKE